MTTPTELVISALETAGCNPRQRGDQWQARCPAHEDGTPSLCVTTGQDGRALVHCQAGCELDAVVTALGLTTADLFVDERPDDRAQLTDAYDYTDEVGTLLYQVLRYSPKAFRQRIPNGDGWAWKLNGVRRVPFRLAELLAEAKNGGVVHIVEGEKDALAVIRAGEVGTCAAGGAGKWRDEYAEFFTGLAEVRVVTDRDLPGYRHARAVARSLSAVVDSVLVCEPRHGKDASDHLAAGLALEDLALVTAEELDQLCADATPPDDADPDPIDGPSLSGPIRLKSGATFVLDDRADLDPIWGSDDEVLWASLEPLLIVGPTGVGKTTLALQVLAARLGILDEVLGWPVKPVDRPILYLAMDRPMQIRRAMRRLFGEEHRQLLEERLVVHEGPLPLDLGRVPEQLLDIVQTADAGSVFIDSLKDAAVKITDDEVGGNLNRAVQYVVRDGIEVMGLHHQRKGQGGSKPTTLEDVYGSTWITAGAGSVLLLWGAAGDPIVELRHLKQPASEIGPLKIETDHFTGRSTVFRGQVDALLIMRRAANGITAAELARLMFECEKPNDNQRKKAQRTLDRLVRDGLAHKSDHVRAGDGGVQPARYHAISERIESAE